jgi:AraC-like DNA-binding protein
MSTPRPAARNAGAPSIVTTAAWKLALGRLPALPYCSDDFERGTYRKSRDLALRHAHVQFNWTDSCSVLLFDVDREKAALAWEAAGLPPPTWIAINPANAHAHLAYVLETPVVRLKDGKSRPARLLRAVRGTMSFLLGADPAYSGGLTKNPLSPRWRTVFHDRTYTLAELMEYIKDDQMRAAISASKRSSSDIAGAVVTSRKVTLFHSLRQFGYQNWEAIVQEARAGRRDLLEAAARQFNKGIGSKPPLGDRAMMSVIRQIQRWLTSKFNPHQLRSALSERQSARQRRSAAVKRHKREQGLIAAAEELRTAGHKVTIAALAKRTGCSSKNLKRHYADQLQTLL